MKVLRKVAEGVATDAKLEKPPGMEGRVLSILLAPSSQQNQQKERDRQKKAELVSTTVSSAPDVEGTTKEE